MAKNKLSDRHATIVMRLRERGWTVKAIAGRLGVTHTTLIRFMKRYGISGRRIPPTDQHITPEVIERYRAGTSITSIAQDIGACPDTTRAALERAGVTLRCAWSRNSEGSHGLQRITDEDAASILYGYLEGQSLSHIAAHHKVAVSTVRKFLMGNGVTLRRKGPEPKSDRDKLNTKIQRLYGLSIDELEALHAAQGGVCAICGVGPGHGRNHGKSVLCVDHCHNTGTVRGLLCHMCNLAISHLEDRPDWVANAYSYLS